MNPEGQLSIFLLTAASLLWCSWFSTCGWMSAAAWCLGCILVYHMTDDSELIPAEGKSVFITGCDSGFGHELAKYLDARGVRVYAGCLLPEGDGAECLRQTCSNRLSVLPLDVTSQNTVDDCVTAVTSQSGADGLWGIVNNAGIDLSLEAELTSMDQYKRVAEVNLFGLVRVTKSFLPLLRKSQGRVVNLTSVKGVLPEQHSAGYCITKFGAEAFSDSLRLEMRKWGVKVCLVEPGQFDAATRVSSNPAWPKQFQECWDSMTPEQREDYGEDYVFHKIRAPKDPNNNGCATADPVSKAMEHALFAVRPRIRYMVDGSSGSFYDKHCVAARLRRWLPTGIMDWYMENVFLGDYPLPAALRK